MRWVYLVVLAALVAGCGSGGGAAAVGGGGQGTVLVRVASSAPSNATVLYAVQFTLRLPPGVAVAADSGTGEVEAGVLRPADGAAMAGASLTPASSGNRGSVRVNIIDANGFLVGDLATLSCSVAAGTTVSATSFAVEDFAAKDADGMVLGEVSPRLSLQPQ